MSRVRLLPQSFSSLLGLSWSAGFRALGTLKHAQIAAVEWNREAIARVKAGVGVYGMSSYPCILVYAWIDGVLLGSCRCSVPVREHRRALRNEHTGNRRVAGLMATDKTKRNPAMFRRYNYILLLLPAQVMLYYCDLSFREFSIRLISLSNFPDSESLPHPAVRFRPSHVRPGREPNSVHGHGPCHTSRPADRERILSLCASREHLAGCLRRCARRRRHNVNRKLQSEVCYQLEGCGA